MSDVKERPMLMKGPLVVRTLEGWKTETRRPVKANMLALYDLSEDRISAIHMDHENFDRHCSQADTGISERRLHGRRRWSDLLQDQVCRLWAEGARGLVCVERLRGKKRLPYRLALSRQQEGDEVGSSSRMSGVPRESSIEIPSGSASRRDTGQQPPKESHMGDAGGELAGSRSPRAWLRGREASCCEAERLREATSALGRLQGAVQPASRSPRLGDVSVRDLSDLPWVVGESLYVRENVQYPESHNALSPSSIGELYQHLEGVGGLWAPIKYCADGSHIHSQAIEVGDGWGKVRPGIHMPRWACRLVLEITSVKISRVQDITRSEVLSEGVRPPDGGSERIADVTVIDSFSRLWDEMYAGGDYAWDKSPWVWVVKFKTVSA